MRHFFRVIVAFAAALIGTIVFMTPAAAQEVPISPDYDATLNVTGCSTDTVTVAVTVSNNSDAVVFVAVQTAPNKGASVPLAAGSSEVFTFESQPRSGSAVVEFSDSENVDDTTTHMTVRLPWECGEEEVPPTTVPMPDPEVVTPPVVEPTVSPTPPVPVTRAAATNRSNELPLTGSSDALLVAIAIGLIGVGICCTAIDKRLRLQ